MTSNDTAVALGALAVIATMPEELPAPLAKVHWMAWIYGWLHDAAKTFVSFRMPNKVEKKEHPQNGQ